MKAVIYTNTIKKMDELCIELVTKGIEAIETNSLEKTLSILRQISDINIVISEDYEKSTIDSFIDSNPSLSIFILSNTALAESVVSNLLSTGIKSVILYKTKMEELAADIEKSIIESDIHTSERRKHIRVQPAPGESLSGAIYLPDNQHFIRGRIVDLSAGGFAFRVFNPQEMDLLIPGTIYSQVTIYLRSEELKTIATLLRVVKDAAGFKFTSLSPYELNKISGYIHIKFLESLYKVIGLP